MSAAWGVVACNVALMAFAVYEMITGSALAGTLGDATREDERFSFWFAICGQIFVALIFMLIGFAYV